MPFPFLPNGFTDKSAGMFAWSLCLALPQITNGSTPDTDERFCHFATRAAPEQLAPLDFVCVGTATVRRKPFRAHWVVPGPVHRYKPLVLTAAFP